MSRPVDQGRNLQKSIMWDIYVADEVGVFKANSLSLDIIAAEYFMAQLDRDLVAFLLPAGGSLVGFGGLTVDA